jgi:hypothetical protein
MMKHFAILLLCLFAANQARADETGQCRANAGTYLTGQVIAGPSFARGHPRRGVELSHTHLTLRADQDGRSYDVAIDNVFAAGYDDAGESVPAPLSTLQPGTRLELCGKPYAQGQLGIDWVHTDCGDPPTADKPDGWVKVLAADGSAGANLEGSQEYCRLWR